MSSVNIAGDVSGAISIAAPSAAGSGVLTLPTGTDTLIGKATTDTLTNKSIAATQLTGTIAAAALPAGSVLQVVNATTSTYVTNSTSVYADTGLTATITPSSTSSKILVLFNQIISKSNGNSGNSVAIKIFRGATDLGIFANGQLYNSTASEVYGSCGSNYLDSPATISATTYKTRFANPNNTALASCQPDSNGKSTITLMEIQG